MPSRAVSGTRRAFKELVDGTIRVQIDVDPESRRDFLRLFPDIDTRVAIAPLKVEAEKDPNALKGGELAKLAGILCGDEQFQEWLLAHHAHTGSSIPNHVDASEATAIIVRRICGVTSRAELDHNQGAAAIFHEQIRKPWLEFKGQN